MLKRIALQSLSIGIIVTIWAMIFNALSAGGISLVGNEDQFRVKPATDRIDLSLAKEKYDSGVAVFIDCRPGVNFDEGHIPGAVFLPAHDLDSALPDFLAQYFPDSTYITYCDGTECDASVIVANRLKEYGFHKVNVFFGGWNEWREAGLPIEVQRRESGAESASDPSRENPSNSAEVKS